MANDPELRRLTLAASLLGFTGPNPPRWLLQALEDGLGGVVLFASNLTGDVGALTARLRSAAGRDVVIATDEEGGDVTRLDARVGSASPGAAALGHVDSPAVTEQAYRAIGDRLAEAGMTMNLAPVADVNVDAANPVIGVRSFGADGALVGRHVAAAVRGVQRSGVAACVKHFPGHGATTADSHHEVATVTRSRAELDATELPPFAAAIAAGARAVMTGHLLVPALDEQRLATVSPRITTALLRDELGFTGTVVTDALEMTAVSGTIGMVEGFVQALAAGADCIETGARDYPHLVDELPAAVADALGAGRLTRDRLEDAARRTAALAAPGRPGPAVEPVDALGCLEVIGAMPRVVRPLVLECRPPDGMASGALPWSLAHPLEQVLDGVEVMTVTPQTAAADLAAVAGRPADRTLVAVVRDPLRHRWQRAVIDLVAGRPGSVLVDVGWPDQDALPDRCTVRTRGVAPGLLEATAQLLGGQR